MDMQVNYLFLAVLLFAQAPQILSKNSSSATVHLIDNNDSHDIFKNICEFHTGEYAREISLKLVCCKNDTLKLPGELVHEQLSNELYAECSKKFKDDNNSDFPAAMWNAFICKLQKASAFKSIDNFKFDDIINFITKLYPEQVKKSIKTEAAKCSEIDKQKMHNHQKIQKYMECFYEAENKVCDKPYTSEEKDDDDADDLKKMKELGCPAVPGLGPFESSIEYCCKKRTTPYPIMEFPGTIFRDKNVQEKISQCRASFAMRETELSPEAFKVSTPQTEDYEDHEMHATWDVLCMSACYVEQKNYTKEMIKLDFDKVANFYVHDFGNSMKNSIKNIMERRKKKEKIFLAMDVDTENSKPMDFKELNAKFEKGSEKDRIQYFCKFVDTIAFEERRALHEYCFDEKFGNEWGDDHHSFFVQHH